MNIDKLIAQNLDQSVKGLIVSDSKLVNTSQ